MRKRMSKPDREKLRDLVAELFAKYPPDTVGDEIDFAMSRAVNPKRAGRPEYRKDDVFALQHLCAVMMETMPAKAVACALSSLGYKTETIEKRARQFHARLAKYPPEVTALYRQQVAELANLPQPIRRGGKWKPNLRRPRTKNRI